MPSLVPLTHLGWGSQALTAVLRRHLASKATDNKHVQKEPMRVEFNVAPPDDPVDSSQSSPKVLCPIQTIPSNDGVKLYPGIGLGMLRQEMTAPGRLWLMLRYLDIEGRGALRVANIAKNITPKTSDLRLCGKRQLRNLLRDGEGVFWTRDKTYVWLHSAAKVAYALNVVRLTSHPVALPIAAMLDGIGAFRAHLYAAFHSGRTKETGKQRVGMPIARDTLAGLSGVGRSSQRAYEARVGMSIQPNFAIGHLSTKENQEKQGWQQGSALFELKDYRGQQGKRGKIYLAWQLPNTYIGQHQKRPLGRQRRINRKLKDLVMKGMPGNVEKTDETQKPEKMYFPNGKLAAKAHKRAPERESYWQRHRTRNGRFGMWQQLETV
ncbi:MAG: hypothetical protein GY943_15585 [Chloroflexi bacterium]|nr:hypothetical protein [Chloroflexota bacterium]